MEEETKQPAFDRGDGYAKTRPTPLTHIYFAVGNKEHHESDLEEKDELDLDVRLEMQSLEIIYRAETVGDISRFFKVKKMTDETKLVAQAKYQ